MKAILLLRATAIAVAIYRANDEIDQASRSIIPSLTPSGLELEA